MPRFRNTRRRSRKKSTRKSVKSRTRSYVRRPQRIHNRRNNPVSHIARGLMPMKKLIKLTYVETVALTPGSIALSTYRFRSNDLFDPNSTGIGNQYRGFDEMAQFYTRFTVIGSKIVTRWSTAVGHAPGSIFCGVTNSPQAEIVSGQYVTLQEAGRTSYEFKSFDSDGSNTYPLLLTNNFSVKRDKSVTNPLDEPNLSCTASGSPSNVAYFDLSAQSMDASTSMLGLLINVTITAVVVCTNPITLGSS